MNEYLIKITDEYTEKLKGTDIYKNYYEQVKKISNYPELMEQINNFRKENFYIQNAFSNEELFDKTEEFNLKYEKFRENPLVSDFLAAELALCRMMQFIDQHIIEGLDFQ